MTPARECRHERLSWNDYSTRCLYCGALLSLGESNDSIPYAEMRLARALAENHCLWQHKRRRDADATWIQWAACYDEQVGGGR